MNVCMKKIASAIAVVVLAISGVSGQDETVTTTKGTTIQVGDVTYDHTKSSDGKERQ